VSCAETAELIDLPFGLWTREGRRSTSSTVFARWRQWPLVSKHEQQMVSKQPLFDKQIIWCVI